MSSPNSALSFIMYKCNKTIINFVSSRFFKRSCFVIFIVVTWNWINSSKISLSADILKSVNPDDSLENRNINHISVTVKYKPNVLPKIDYSFKIGGLIVVSTLRSGSSFLGQLFNQNPSVFYFFEPLFPLHDS